MDNQIIRTVENGVEFFTVTQTGESGISVSGLALLCGVSKQAISKLINNLSTKEATKSLQTWADKDLNLSTTTRKQGGTVKIFRANFCAAVITHYAFAGNQTAQISLNKFTEAGITLWIQKMTGWQQPQPQPELNSTEPTLSQIESVFAGLYKFPIKTELIESAKLSAIARTIPSLTPSVEEAKRLLSNALVIEELPMTPTEVGVEIAKKLNLSNIPSAKKINQVLCDRGLQVAEHSINRFGKKRIQYKLTETGEKYGQMQLEQARNGNKTLVIVRWFKSVFDVISSSF
jgi:hypothetical protein